MVGCGSPEAQFAEVEVTRIVEVEVPIEVTRIVEVEVTRVVAPTATATAEATVTSEAPAIGTLDSPVPLGQTTSVVNEDNQTATVTVTQVVRGDEAAQMSVAANQFNEPPTEGFELVLALVEVANTSDGVLEINQYETASVTDNQVIGFLDIATEAPCCIEPAFDLELLPDGVGAGWIPMFVKEGDPAPLMLMGSAANGVYFALTP